MSVEPPARLFVARPASKAPPALGTWRYALRLTLVITLGALLLLAIYMPDIVRRRYVDPDDLVRLQQVRDWMAGQSWFDVTQYRVSPPGGMSMHWSRLLDVPIATLIWIVRPFAGQVQAELVASTIVPLATFACLAALAAAITRRITGSDRLALLAAALCPIDCGVVATARPMRIDHHGWQAVCAMAVVLALTGRRGWRTAAVAGACAALWMHISLEGALFTIATGGCLGLLWIYEPSREHGRLSVFLASITIVSLALFLGTHRGALLYHNFADAISPIHLAVFGLATLGSIACWPLAERTATLRCAGLGITALISAAVYEMFGPQHGADPFAALGPLSYRLWYLQIAEGLPLWRLPFQIGVILTGYALLALAGTAFKIRSAQGEARQALLDYGMLLLVATAIGIVLQRACYASNLIALPGGVMLMAGLWKRAMAAQPGPLRVAAAACAVAATSPGSPAIAAMTMIPDGKSVPSAADERLAQQATACIDMDNLAHLDALRPSLFLTPVSSAEALVAGSHHRSVAAGYHRDRDPLEDSIRFFTGTEGDAHTIARQHHIDYVLICPGDGGPRIYAAVAPGGLAARLAEGNPPDWLRPVSVPGLRYARVYRLID